jgi:tetracycline 7-halogenase / FADH2 O2-dependent halogenase
MSASYDIAVVGSGFAGSLMAMIARRLGRSVVLIEKGSHPRVVIGESSTPLANLLLGDLCDRYELPAIRSLAKWGTWQRMHPQLACGLKRGFTFHHHVLDSSHSFDRERRDQLLVAASPHDQIADAHWYRADLDSFLVKQAQELGVDYFDGVALRSFQQDSKETQLSGVRDGYPVDFRVRLVIDASGPRGFIHRALGLAEAPLPDYPDTQSLYSHFSGVGGLAGTMHSRTDELPPYPIDAAAVHHVFAGGWVWVLHFNNGITSAGVAATDACAAQLRLADGAQAWQRLLERIPALQSQFAAAQAERPFSFLPRLSFRSVAIAGERWALLPSSAGFVDPLLSTGFPLTLLGVARLASIIERDWESGSFGTQLEAYAAQTDEELLAAAQLIAALYANMDKFDVFAALTLIYFAAASFSESARRLGKPQLAPSFLLCTHPEFGPACRRLCARARHRLTGSASRGLIAEILAVIEPFNVAGLGKPELRNWYPADADDLLNAATKLNADREEIMALIERCGFHREPITDSAPMTSLP